MDAPDTPLRVKKRSHSHMSPEGVSKSDMERSEPGRDRKDKKRRKKKRKISVVQEVDTQPSASARAPASKDSITLNPPTSSPEPIFESMRTSGPTLKPSSNYVVSSEPEPEFVQGSSASTIKGAKSPIVDVAAQTEETTTLKQSLEIQTKSLNSHTALLASLLPSLTCQVCLDLLYKPFALAPCGHMVCYSCLVTWFTTPPTNDNVHELPIYRKKTCPHCRAVVRNRPAEVWGVKEMVANVVKSGLAVGFPVPPVDDVNRNPAARDPWANIFHALPGAVAAPGMAHPPEGDLANLGMFDAEDGVYRCLDCMHEIWEGSCAQCGRIYPGHDVGFMGSDDDEDDVAHMVNALRNGLVNGFHPVQQVLGLLGNGNGEGDHLSDDDDGGSDGSYDSSFIDDDGQDGGDARRVIDLTSEPDDDDAGEVRQLGRGWRHGRPQQHSPDIIELDDEDEDEPIPPPPPRGRRARIVEDEDEDEVTHEHYASRSHSIGRDGYSSQDSERDDSDDDGAIPGPARRLAHYIREPSFDDDDASGRSDDEDDYTGEHQYRAALFSPRSAYDDDEENELSGDEYESGDGY